MKFFRTFHEAEATTEFTVKGIRVVAHDIEPAARGRTLEAEGAHDDVASRPHSAYDLVNIRRTLLGHGQEVENGPIVPNVICIGFQSRRYEIPDNPPHQPGISAQSLLRDFNRRFRNIEDGQMSVSTGQKIVYQCGFAAADINNRRVQPAGSTLDESE